MSKTKNRIYKILRIIGKIILGILIFLLLVILFIRSPWGQNIIKDKFISNLEDKTGTKINLDKLYVKFNGDIALKGLYIEDKQGDTLIYSESLSASVPIMPIIKGKSFSVDDVDWQHVVANISRKDTISGFNYEFLMNALVATDTTQTAKTDTTSAMPVNLGDFDLKNFRVSYNDQVAGIDSKIKFDTLEVGFTESDLQKMVFRADNVHLANSKIDVEQTHQPVPTDSSSAPMPLLAFNNLSVNDVKINYKSQPDSLQTDINVQKLVLENSVFNLKENKINTDLLSLKNSGIAMQMRQEPSGQTQQQPSDSAFVWPPWKINADKINLENDYFNYVVNGAEVTKGNFNPNAVKIDSLDLQASNLSYEPHNISLDVEELQLEEASGLDVNRFNFSAKLNDERLVVKDLDAAINGNSLHAQLTVNYSDFNDFIQNPGNAYVTGQINNLHLDLSDIYRFQPSLRENQYFKALASSPINGDLSVKGKMEDLKLNSLNLNWSKTHISGTGTITNIQDPQKLHFQLPNTKIKSRRSDIIKFINEDSLGVRIPENLSLTGSFSGDMNSIKTNSVLKTSEGTLDIKGNFTSGEKLAFDAEIKGDSIALGRILQNKALGNLNISLDLKGKGSNISDLDATLSSNISSFEYNNYDFRNIRIRGNIENGKGPLDLRYNDENLDIEAQTNIQLDSVSPRIDYTVYLDGAALGDLGITQRNIKAGFVLKGWYKGNANSYEVQAEIEDGVAVFNNKTYLLGNFKASAFVQPDTTSVQVDNRMLDLNLQSNASPVQISAAINRHFKRYISDNFKQDSIVEPVNLKLDAKIREAPILTEVFLVNLEEIDTVDVNIDFKEEKRSLDAMVSVPHARYMGFVVDSLQLDMNSDAQDINFEFAFNTLSGGPLDIKNTLLKGEVEQRKLNLDFTSTYDDKTLVHTNSQLNFQGDTLEYHIDPQNLILNGNPWNIAASNKIAIDSSYLDFEDFRLSRNDQYFQITNAKTGEEEHLKMEFNNFKLATFLKYLNPEDQLASGNLNGDMLLKEPFGKTGLVADMAINQFKVMNVDLSTLTLKGNTSGFNNYDFEMQIFGGVADMDLTGSYVATDSTSVIDMNLDLNEVKMKALEGFTQGAVKNASGSFSGNISFDGTLQDPKYEGQINFDQAKFNLAFLNAAFVLPDEQLKLNNEAVYFNDFDIKDLNNNTLTVNGKITTENYLNPGFDLDIQAQNFNLLNSTKEDNDLFYGKAVVDVDAQVSGDLNLPVVDANVEINENTNFTYVVPEAEAEIKARDGVVIFVNKENPDDILTQREEVAYVVSGFDIYARVKIDEGATFSTILNPTTGDKFQVQGEGDLIFNMYPNGRISLTGIYNINDGFYEMSLYNLVKRRFDIADGSEISWSGDPYDAKLDVTAIYRVETSASSLMAPLSSGTDAGNITQYRRQYPFLVYLYIDGQLMEPKISFGLGMPEDARGEAGVVYSQVQQLSNQEDELNKQVFSLLVLNRFFPYSGSTGASGGTLAVARDNLNEALSDQLNMLSSRLLGESGIKLNFDVDSYTDYQGESAQNRTQLDINAQKAFLEDRLIVQVGSEVDIQGGNRPGQETSPVIGNVSIAYLLDEDGTWRLKAFRKNQYENVIDGQLIVSGISLVFTKEFNKFENLFAKAVIEESQKGSKKKEKNSETGNDKATENEN
ncbi:hypothetical protein C7S20_14270 [Christiangramia fulva]|uniref:Translocation and assembly module TamB C-terminal domain-containing protein n=1 Tax=Christiangramia fulva TaxID=2126553 RepID=A0A2R3Z7W7_9FLAO|nr:translocation/assembly module TamB domain-containing protein [Christiangramia fulva]AVR46335.1 hypothetical protein C7S20_14270 [Christiangramia fulva]